MSDKYLLNSLYGKFAESETVDKVQCPECGAMVSVLVKMEQTGRFYVLRAHKYRGASLRALGRCKGSGMEMKYGKR